MHFYKKFKHACMLFVGMGMLLLLPLEAFANHKILIKSAELYAFDDYYYLNANAEVKLGEEIEQTLLTGFELSFILEFQLASPKKYWFDDEIITITYPITLSYHHLSRQFLLTQGGVQKSFTSLSEVSAELGKLRQIKIIKKSEVEKSEAYKALLLLRLDYRKLPKAIQEVAIESPDWDLTSQRFEWIPAIFK